MVWEIGWKARDEEEDKQNEGDGGGRRVAVVVGGNIRAPSIPDSHSGLGEPRRALMSSPVAHVGALRTAPSPWSPSLTSPPITQH